MEGSNLRLTFRALPAMKAEGPQLLADHIHMKVVNETVGSDARVCNASPTWLFPSASHVLALQ